ncbi:baseplate J/gp47 family protein [Dethiothermospora halolimnae]|uniref:baseplate J/gp47 family protein n=1 Tax=Dethiothermospora halolimnae TaxID=3114390 RepID=UPI003CCC1942
MAKFGVTEKGFKRKQYANIISDMETNAKQLFGDNINLSPRSPLGLFLKVVAWELSQSWQVAEDTYHSGFVDTSENNSLDGTVKYAAVNRKRANPATVEQQKFIGEVGTKIPLGFKVARKDGFTYQTTEVGEIDDTGEVIIPLIATTEGQAGNTPTGTITEVVNPISGLSSTTNLTDAENGTNREEDYELRDRYYRSLAQGGSSTAESIQAELLDITDVIDVIVEENDTTVEINGIPPKSVAPFVFGGVDEEIAKAILRVKAGGIQSYGDIVIPTDDSRGVTHQIGFTRPTEIGVYVNVSLVTDNDFPVDGDEEVRTEIIKYIGGVDKDNTNYNGLGLGYDVIWSKIIAKIQGNIDGIEDLTVELSTDNTNFNQSNVSIDTREVATTDYNKVVVS